MLVPSGNSRSGWKFSHRFWDIGGEFRVTRYRSGGVAGTEYDGLKGVGGRVLLRDAPVPKKTSPEWRKVGDNVDGAAMLPPIPG